MTTALTESGCRALARQVDELLVSLTGDLDASLNPHRLAMRGLGMSSMGWTKTPYTEEAFKAWSALAARQPVETATLHHLAIMHHARAFDREAGEDPMSANEDWEAAMEYWSRLSQADAFWDHIASIACRNTKRDAADALREAFPQLILQVHYDIAFDPNTSLHRAKYHIRRAMRSPFSKEAREAVRRATYLRFIRHVPANVWQVDTLDPEVIEQGTDRIQAYLEIDPGCLPALEDALRLQVRVLRARYQDLQALSGSQAMERTALLQKMHEAADYWQPYLDQLVAEADWLDEETRHKLCLWYRVTADVHCSLENEARAIQLYELGILAGSDDDDEKRRCMQSLEDTHAYLARQRALAGASDAKTFCDQIGRRLALSLPAHFVLANAYVLLDEFDAARDVCHRGLAIELDSAETDFEVIEQFTLDQEKLRDLIVSADRAERDQLAERFIEQAKEQINAKAYSNALPILNEILAKTPENETALFLRCRCYIAELQIADAQRDLDEYERRSGRSESTRSTLASLQIEINEKAALIDKYGIRRARLLHEEAIAAFVADRYEEAVRVYRQALEAAVNSEMGEGDSPLKKEMSVALTSLAIEQVNDAGENVSRDVYEQAENMLREARQLDPANRQAAENLKILLRRMAEDH